MRLPANTRLVAPQDRLDFLDSQSCTLGAPLTPLEAWDRITRAPMPLLKLAFRLRDAISARFGVQRIGGFSGQRPDAPQIGDRLDFFVIEGLTSQALTLTARDRHLDVMTCVTVEGLRLSVTASVVTHNRFGRAYMIPVAPAHRWIVRRMLRRLAA